MSATKKDFERMAEYLRFVHLDPFEQAAAVRLVTEMLDELYPRFDADKFVRACVKKELK